MNRFQSDYPMSSVWIITPDLAADALKTSIGNRVRQPAHIAALSGAMKRGEFRITNQGIGFDVNGHLRDGHHRLLACIDSGVTFHSIVTLGMPVSSYAVIDTGKTRSYADRLALSREEAEVIRLGCSIALDCSRPTVDQMNPYINSMFGDVTAKLASVSKSNRRIVGAATMRLAAVVSILDGEREEYVIEQYATLMKMDLASMNHVSLGLVRQIENHHASAQHGHDLLARGLIVYSESHCNDKLIRVSAADTTAAKKRVKSVLNRVSGIAS